MAPRMGMPPEMPQFPGKTNPKFPGMMQPIRDPELVGPLPMMPPLTPMPIVEETLGRFCAIIRKRIYERPIKRGFLEEMKFVMIHFI